MATDLARPHWAALLTRFSWPQLWPRSRGPLLQPVPGSPTNRDRRQSERFLCELVVSCRAVTLVEFQPILGKVRDMSAGGVGLRLKQGLEVGTFLILELSSPEGGEGNRLCVKVVHSSVEDSVTWRVGCSIVRESVTVREPEDEGRLILSP